MNKPMDDLDHARKAVAEIRRKKVSWTAGFLRGEEAAKANEARRVETLAWTGRHFKVVLEIADIALNDPKVDYLVSDDRAILQNAVHWINFWLPVFTKSKNADEVREAGLWLAAYDHVIGARAVVCDSEEEYWRRRKCSKGGAAL